ncbi:hypothetical protein IFM89_030602 [Coptis chinensis]|uniref:Uncharacterized protein n=1 Tax=Coptis chinensis TaxID=261450 RepID=A0A835HNK8_9MAGN|nr:hypothetical protein IFM89_030602 [Coptis chinensis]
MGLWRDGIRMVAQGIDRGEYNGKKWHGIVERGYKPIYGIVKSIGALESEKPWERMNGLPKEPLTVARGGVDVDPSIVDPISSFYKKLAEFSQGKLIE